MKRIILIAIIALSKKTERNRRSDRKVPAETKKLEGMNYGMENFTAPGNHERGKKAS